MAKIIFYSWQSDLPNNTNRGFIESCLLKVVKSLANLEVNLDIAIDRDTKGVTGMPDISNVIFDKISSSNIFIGDISFIDSKRSKKRVANPNVLIELGFAAKAIGWENIICIFNLDYGRVEQIPFDLRHRRLLTYKIDDLNNKAKDREILVLKLREEISSIIQKQSNKEQVIDYIKMQLDKEVLKICNHVKKILFGYSKFMTTAAITGAADFKRRGIDIAGYNTIQNADDLNDLRLALGAEKMNLLAYSYGTHLALATARKYSSFVDNMVLIGPSGLNHMHHLPFTYDKQLKRISDMAARDSLINKEVPDMVNLLKRITEKLEKQPIYITIKDFRARQMVTIPIGKFGLQLLLRFDIGDSNDFIYFPALLYGIEYGDYRLLQLYAQRRYNQYNGAYGSGIYAMRQASGATQQRYAQIATEGKTALLGNAMNTPDIYAGWDNIDLGDSFRASFKSTIRTLFISGTMDSNTPSSNVEELEKGFSNSTHIIIQNAGHEDMLPAGQVQELIISFIRKENISLTPITLPKPRFVAVF